MPRPPFRADHVGSFLRPERLREARERFAAGGLPAAELHAIEDACIREVVRAQEDVGLKGITDGEFRRTFFHVDFLERFEGVETHYGEFVAKFRKDDGSEVGFKPPTMHVGSKVKWVGPIQGPTSISSSQRRRARRKSASRRRRCCTSAAGARRSARRSIRALRISTTI